MNIYYQDMRANGSPPRLARVVEDSDSVAAAVVDVARQISGHPSADFEVRDGATMVRLPDGGAIYVYAECAAQLG